MAPALSRFLLLVATLLSPIFAQAYLDPASNESDSDTTRPGRCPGYLPSSSNFEFPHLIIPISSRHPTTAYANTLTPFVTAGDFSAVFTFDIPEGRTGQMCTFRFFFPNETQLSTSSFRLDGVGTYSFSLSMLGAGAVAGQTTFDDQPLQSNPHGFPPEIRMRPGHAYSIGQTICVPGRISVTMSSADSNLTWFQDWNECPLGLFITYSP